MKLSLSNRIERYCRKNYPNWTNGGEFERMSLAIGYKASNASRRCRELAEAGILERREKNGSVEYRFNIERYQKVTYRIPEINHEIMQLKLC